MQSEIDDTLSIIYLENKNIDRLKWDECINGAYNGLIYAYSFYLDAMAVHWDALVLNDYQAVMPVTWNKKIGVYYLHQPFFCASLGVFGKEISSTLVIQFLKTIPKKLKYWDIYLNYGNVLSSGNFKNYMRSNFVLDLNNNYENIRSSFSQNHNRNIRKAEKLNLYSETNFSAKEIIHLAKQQSKKFSPVSDNDYKNFLSLYEYLRIQNKAITYGIFTAQKKLVAGCIFFFSHKRAYYILAGNHPDGRNLGASHLLINTFIKEHAGENLLLDFEGSQVKSLARFYKSFGSKEEKIPAIKYNNLPWILKLFKK